MLLDILLFPFTLAGWLIRGLFGLVGGLIGAVGGFLGLIFGLGMTVIGIVLCVSLIGWIFGIPLLALLGFLSLLFPIIGAIKASSGELWRYPLSFPIFS